MQYHSRNNEGCVANRHMAKLPEVVGKEFASNWEHLLRGLWLSGLRLDEALSLKWESDDSIHIRNLDDRRPIFRIFEGDEKGRKDRILLMTPDVVAFLRQHPPDQRKGFVFNPLGPSGRLKSMREVSRKISLIGETAIVKVNSDSESGKVKYASAQDLRRSFGARWASKVLPVTLKKLMRHETIETTMKFYVGHMAERTADDVWRAFRDEFCDTFCDTPKNEDIDSQLPK